MPTCYIKFVKTIEDGEPPANQVYWSGGQRWIRDKDGEEHALLDLAPNLEREFHSELLLRGDDDIEVRCMLRSLPFKGIK